MIRKGKIGISEKIVLHQKPTAPSDGTREDRRCGLSPRWTDICRLRPRAYAGAIVPGGEVDKPTQGVRLSDEQRIDWLRLIRSQNVGPRGIMAQLPEAY
jgi:hypothetical protein